MIKQLGGHQMSRQSKPTTTPLKEANTGKKFIQAHEGESISHTGSASVWLHSVLLLSGEF